MRRGNLMIINAFTRSPANGTYYESKSKKASSVEFLYDLTYENQGESIKEHVIFHEELKLIQEAEKVIILDMFLFNDNYNRDIGIEYPDLSAQLTQALITKKRNRPDIKILFITDEINNFYGVYETWQIKSLKENGIHLLVTDLNKIRDPNPTYSGIWRSLFQWFGTSGKGWLPNPFSSHAPKVTLRGYLKLLNFKANHRKVLITENEAIVSSMNPHDASGYHSNIAFKISGDIIFDLIESELSVAKWSGLDDLDAFRIDSPSDAKEKNSQVSIITEGKIKDNLINEISATRDGDRITLGMFYIGHRNTVKELIDASNRGVDVRLVLDANKDAFGLEKDGVPNRPVADEMIRKSHGKMSIKWYKTHGEQFHTKMTFIEKENHSIIIGGSANLTRRNLDNFNLETNLFIVTSKDTKLNKDIKAYFDRIWTNKKAVYTLDYEEYEDSSIFKRWKYRFQEWSGLSSF